MIEIPPLTADLLAALGEELGGCDFSGESQRAFLSSAVSCDVQAAPGNGKTTLLVAKLSLLSRNWVSRSEGVCVISHTNAARIEVEKQLTSHAGASAFLNYPHFIGTVTTFIDRFLALPYLRGLGWPLRRIDDAAFADIAKRQITSRPNLRSIARHQSMNVDNWVANLQFAPDFNFTPGAVPARIAVRQLPRQPNSGTASGAELEQIKASMTRDGYYRFGDMIALATRALDDCPLLVQRVRARFPLVILDEAQDTHGPQLALLRRLFGPGEGDVAFQLLGDQNQTLYEDASLLPADYWQPAAGAIPLYETRRFGAAIAGFASRLTVRSPQAIAGLPDKPGHRCLIMFDKDTIGTVLPNYAGRVRDHWQNDIPEGHETWAVSSRHNLYRDTRGDWPKSLVDYHPAYRPASSGSSKPTSFCAILRQAAALHANCDPPARIVELFGQAILEFLRLAEYATPHGGNVTQSNLWRVLAVDDGKHLKIRHLLLTHILQGNGVWNAAAWQEFLSALAEASGISLPGDDDIGDYPAYVAFVEQGADGDEGGPEPSRNFVIANGVRIQLGSIHAVKGKTVDAILVMETQVYRGPAADQQVMDLTTVLSHALGIENHDFNANHARLTAATNVFVGVTRPRTLLGLAIRKANVSNAMVDAAVEQGWYIHDVTV
jgi:DNA helicase-2/ATP-dependent DNA helicase PcrA